MIGATLYLAGFENGQKMTTGIQPCVICMRMIMNAGIIRVITEENKNDFDISGE